MAREFGRTIETAKANELFGNLTEIKAASQPLIYDALQTLSSPLKEKCLRYYCGRPGQVPLEEDIAYVFDKESLEHILKLIEKGKANGCVMFQGARNRVDSEHPLGSGNYTDVDGRPTVMMFACSYKRNTISGKEVIEVINLTDVGEEHPGSGSEKVDQHNPELPGSFAQGRVCHFV